METILDTYGEYVVHTLIWYWNMEGGLSTNGRFEAFMNIVLYGPDAQKVRTANLDPTDACIQALDRTIMSLYSRERVGKLLLPRVIRWTETYVPDPARKDRMREAGYDDIAAMMSDDPFQTARVNVRRDGRTSGTRRLVALLRSGNHEEFNRIKSKYLRDDFVYEEGLVHLTDVDLRGIDLRKFNLANVCFDGSNLSGANFAGMALYIAAIEADFTGADFEGCALSCCNLFSCKLGARFVNATLSCVYVDGSDFSHANFEGTSLEGIERIGQARFAGATLTTEQVRTILRGTIDDICSFGTGADSERLERKLLRGKSRLAQLTGSAE